MHGQDLRDATVALRDELTAAAATPFDGQIENAPTLIRSFEVWANILDRYPKLTALLKEQATAVERAVKLRSFVEAASAVTDQVGDRRWQADPDRPSTWLTRPQISAADERNSRREEHPTRPITDHVTLLDLAGAIRHELNLNPVESLRGALQGLLSETESAISQTDDVYGDAVRFTWLVCTDREFLKSCLSTELYGPSHVPFLALGAEWIGAKAEELRIVKAFNWSTPRAPKTWRILLKECFESISDETFRLMRNGEHKIQLRQHPDSTRKTVSLDLDDLGQLGYLGD